MHLWDKLHNQFYQQAGGDDVMVKTGDILPGVAQGYLIDKKTADQYNIKYITDLKSQRSPSCSTPTVTARPT